MKPDLSGLVSVLDFKLEQQIYADEKTRMNLPCPASKSKMFPASSPFACTHSQAMPFALLSMNVLLVFVMIGISSDFNPNR